jgi:hypothetical protein
VGCECKRYKLNDMGLFTERETDNKIENWIARKGNVIAAVFVIFSYTMVVFFLGMVFEWEHYGRVQQYEIQTKIVEYRLGNITLGRDTMNVVTEKYK